MEVRRSVGAECFIKCLLKNRAFAVLVFVSFFCYKFLAVEHRAGSDVRSRN